MNIVETLRNSEAQLLNPAVRKDPLAVAALLTDDFREFGSSGRVYTKREIIAALGTEQQAVIEMTDLAAVELCRGIVLVTYRSRREGVEALRSSVWVRKGKTWKMAFHQGTRVGSQDVSIRRMTIAGAAKGDAMKKRYL